VPGKEVVSRSGQIVTKLSAISQPNVLQGGVTTMNKRTIFISCLLVLTLIPTFAACGESAGEFVTTRSSRRR